MKKSILSVLALVLGGSSVFAADFTSDFKPFSFPGRPAAGSIADCSGMNVPITENERIFVGEDGHLYADGKRIRIFGTNVSQFPKVEDAEYWAKTIASQGYNCVRFHHTDSDWAECFFKHDANWTKVYFDETAFERFDKFFYELKKAGVYTNINLLTGRTIRPDSQNKLPEELKQIKDWKDRHCYGFWNKLAREEQLEYAKKILTHKNPYTGLTYAQDPAVCFVEINNENSMTKCYLDGALERFPSSLTAELDSLWTDFLKKKGRNFQELAKKFNQTEKMGENLLAVKGNLEQHNGAKAEIKESPGAAKIKVKANGTAGWHVQYDLYGFKTEPDQMYTISFKAKASKESTVDVGVMMNHDPWRNLGFSKHVKVGKEWQDFSLTVAFLEPDEKPRLTLGGMGMSSGTTFEFSDIKFCKGGNVVCIEKSERGVKLPSYDSYRKLPLELRLLVTEFLVSIDEDYWGSMNDYLKKTLGIKALTFGTALPCASISVMAKFDVVDAHAYWNHPVFPVSSWNTKDYYVKNQSLTTADDTGTLGSLANMRVFGKPFSVTEYDHPYPNQFSAEMMPMFAVYASLQDWDCVYSFCYDLSIRNPDKAKITGYFDQANNPAKIAAVPVAARIFREFKIKPLSKGVYYAVTKEGELKAIAEKGGAWKNVPPTYFGIRPEDSIFYRTGALLEGESLSDLRPVQDLREELDLKIMDRKGGVDSVNCDGNLLWNSADGIFVFSDDDCFASVSMPGTKTGTRSGSAGTGAGDSLEKRADDVLETLAFIPSDDFASVAGVKIDDTRWLIFSCSWSGNLGEKLREYGKEAGGGVKAGSKKIPANPLTRQNVNLSTEYSGSGTVAAALGSSGKLVVQAGGENASRENSTKSNGKLENQNAKFKLYSLDKNGKRKSEIKNFTLDAADQTLWYELELE